MKKVTREVKSVFLEGLKDWKEKIKNRIDQMIEEGKDTGKIEELEDTLERINKNIVREKKKLLNQCRG